jgi:hypothetical protein
MVVSKEEFNRALTEINSSWAKMSNRVKELEEKVNALEAAKPTATRKRSTKEDAKDAA